MRGLSARLGLRVRLTSVGLSVCRSVGLSVWRTAVWRAADRGRTRVCMRFAPWRLCGSFSDRPITSDRPSGRSRPTGRAALVCGGLSRCNFCVGAQRMGREILTCQSGGARVASNSRNRPAKQVRDPRWLNQYSLNRDPARRHGSVCSVRQSGMPKEPRRGPAVLDGFTSDSTHGPAGRFPFLRTSLNTCSTDAEVKGFILSGP